EHVQLLRMGESKSFFAYSTGACTLCTMLNFKHKVISGMKVHNFHILLNLHSNKRRLNNKLSLLMKTCPVKPCINQRLRHPQRRLLLAKPPLKKIYGDYAFDSKGLCHHCKKPCGNTLGEFTEPASRYVANTKPTRIFIDFHHDGNNYLWFFSRPAKVSLPLQGGKNKPIMIFQFVTTTLEDPKSGLSFPNLNLKVGPFVGYHDMILGIPVLSTLSLLVSIPSQSI
ncbi:hypothetical protein VP01_5342g1, partial [Puccinia sorghi]